MRHAILEKNDRLAERNRGFFRARGLLVINVLSSPGSGKTTLIGETIRRLGARLKSAVIVGDLATDNDARRLRESGAPVVQINTGTVCHLEADMVARAVKQLDLTGLDLLIIENVGNLVCPASYDLGEDLRVVLLSVTDGEDKPLKYPPMFHLANAVVISKVDLDRACDFNREAATANLRHIAHHAPALRGLLQNRGRPGGVVRFSGPAARGVPKAQPAVASTRAATELQLTLRPHGGQTILVTFQVSSGRDASPRRPNRDRHARTPRRGVPT